MAATSFWGKFLWSFRTHRDNGPYNLAHLDHVNAAIGDPYGTSFNFTLHPA
ncbi:hypothetical protein LTS17_010124 [Exophiala oligosperma]